MIYKPIVQQPLRFFSFALVLVISDGFNHNSKHFVFKYLVFPAKFFTQSGHFSICFFMGQNMRHVRLFFVVFAFQFMLVSSWTSR